MIENKKWQQVELGIAAILIIIDIDLTQNYI
jgi:hypothetical protein